MSPGEHDVLLLLVVDHRGSFARLLGTGEDDRARLRDAKRVAWEGLQRAIEPARERGARCGVLVDEELGAEVARAAAASDLTLAMPVERPGQRVLELAYGDDFARHVEAFEPDLVKALVRWNPGDDPDDKKIQAQRLTSLSAWLHATGRTLLLELLLPPTDDDLARVEGDATRFDIELRPELTRRAVREIRDLGVEPDVWQLEGVDERPDAEELLALLRDEGRDHVVALVLGDADDGRLEHRLRLAGGHDGVAGLAIGPPAWREPLGEHLAGRLERDEAAERIAARLIDLLDVHLDAEAT